MDYGMYGEKRNWYRLLVGKTVKGGKPMEDYRREFNITMHLKRNRLRGHGMDSSWYGWDM